MKFTLAFLFTYLFNTLFFSQENDNKVIYKVDIDSSKRYIKEDYKDVPKYIMAVFYYNKPYIIPGQDPLRYYLCNTPRCLDIKYFEQTGFVNNKKELWMHPPRDNDYLKMLELAPYPYIMHYETKWAWSLDIDDKWADKRWRIWEGDVTLNNTYTVLNNNYILKLNSRKYKVKIVSAVMNSVIGNSTAKFYFTNENILIMATYKLINGDLLTITKIS